MGVGHGHQRGREGGTVTGRYRNRLVAALAIALAVLVVEVVGAWLSGSLALLADAGHVLTDAVGLGIALIATQLAQLPPTSRRTFGWQRAEMLAAAANAVILFGVAAFVIVEGIRRFGSQPEIEAGAMLIVAVIGLAANGIALGLLAKAQKESLNMRGAYLEVLGDLLGSVAVVIAAIVVLTVGYDRADAIASILIGLFILPRAWHLFREVTDVLLEATPRGVDLDEVREHMIGIPGVLDVHDLHAWTITSGLPVLSAHVVVDGELLRSGRQGEVLDRLGDCLADHFDVEHSTFQIEPPGHRDHERHTHD